MPAHPKMFLLRLALILCLACLMSARAAAWGSAGHRIIARVAEAYLTPEARAAVSRLLVKEDLASASTYADEVRPDRPETTAWHFVEMPRNARAYVQTRDCVETLRGDCTVAAIERLVNLLKVGKRTPAEQADALKFLVHLVGDLHQPLHCYADDAGGNKIRVIFFGSETNLHAVWDARIIERAIEQGNLSENEYARRLTSLPPGMRDLAAKGTPGDWAFESYELAVKAVDDACEPSTVSKVLQKGGPPDCAVQAAWKPLPLGQQYYDTGLKVIDNQLLLAGVRLALILNEIFK